MKTGSRLAVALGLSLLASAGQAAVEAASVERLAALGKLWVSVKYFHPFLAYKDIDWDTALLAALPKAAAARSTAEYASAVQSMLDVLGDPATRVVGPTPGPGLVPPAANHDGVLVLPAASLRSAVPRIDAAKAVVFDLRRYEEQAGLLFIAAGLNSRLAYGSLKAPGHRSRIHSGLASPWNGGSVYYHSAFYVRDGAVIQGAPGVRQKPLVFLIDASSSLPPILPALQAAGKAKVVAQGGASDASLVEKSVIDLPDGVRVQLRTSELVYEDGSTGLVPDLVVSGTAEDALEAALRAARDPSSVPSAVRPKLPAYGVPRREEAYAASEYPGRELRLLAAFRLWGAFQHFFAYRDLMEVDWNQVLKDFLPRFESAGDATEYALTLAEMAAHARDSHVTLTGSCALDRYLGQASPAVVTRMIEGKPVVTWAAPDTGLSAGDVVTRVDGEEAAARIARLSRYIAASTPQSLDRRVMQLWLNGEPGSEALIEVRNKQVRLKRSLASTPRRERTGDVVQLLPGGAGYVDLDGLLPEQVDGMFERLKSTKAIIFDMRGYPNGTSWLIAPRLTDRKRVAAARFRRPLALAPPGLSGDVGTLGAGWDFVQYLPEPSQWTYRGRTVMLIDERTISQAEHAGLFFRAANGTRFIGSRSAGADGDITNIVVPGGVTISFSGQEIRHADGRPLQRVGLIPDVEVKPTIAGIRAGRDEVLEKALEFLGLQW
ncbi:MAG: S41 family peptidase [Bryobacteraceae bacterium]